MINTLGQSNKMVLHLAAESGNMNIIKYLIEEQNCNPSCLDESNRIPLHYASIHGKLDAVRYLCTVTQASKMLKK